MATDFGLWLRTVDNIDRVLTIPQYRFITKLMNENLDYQHGLGLFDHLHFLIEKKDLCPVCGDERCGCEFHQQTCSHIVEAYMKSVSEGDM